MLKLAQVMRSQAAALPAVLAAHKVIVGLAYLAGYVALDRVSFVEPYAPFGITPWNPNTGLSFVLILVFGVRIIPFLFVSPFLADLVNSHMVLPWTIEILSVALIGAGYSAALGFLQLPKTGFNPALLSMRDLVLLILVAVAGAAFVASSYVGLTIAAGWLSANDFMAAALRYWIGDVIGILVLAPFALFVLAGRQILPMSTETALQCTAIFGALVLVFGFAKEREFQLFYVLFLPIIWMAVRNGTEGVSAGILITQLGVIWELSGYRRTRRADCLPGADARLSRDRVDYGRVGDRATPPESHCACTRNHSRVWHGSAVSVNWPLPWRMKLISP